MLELSILVVAAVRHPIKMALLLELAVLVVLES
jgi:hypothetical protein